MPSPLRLIGYWRNDDNPEYPDPAGFVDPEWDDRDRHMVWWYLLSGTRGPACMGYSTCRICGEVNGSAEYSDDTFAWPEGLAHYVQEHRVRLPKEFVDHALRRLRDHRERGRDTAWWLRKTSG